MTPTAPLGPAEKALGSEVTLTGDILIRFKDNSVLAVPAPYSIKVVAEDSISFANPKGFKVGKIDDATVEIPQHMLKEIRYVAYRPGGTVPAISS